VAKERELTRVLRFLKEVKKPVRQRQAAGYRGDHKQGTCEKSNAGKDDFK
jgi:hypothetical protein